MKRPALAVLALILTLGAILSATPAQAAASRDTTRCVLPPAANQTRPGATCVRNVAQDTPASWAILDCWYNDTFCLVQRPRTDVMVFAHKAPLCVTTTWRAKHTHRPKTAPGATCVLTRGMWLPRSWHVARRVPGGRLVTRPAR